MKINKTFNNLRKPLAILLLFYIWGMVSINCSFAYTSFELTRGKMDKFENPTVTQCDWEQESLKFCKDKKGSCIGGSQKCCFCHCGSPDKSTFDRSTLECRKNVQYRAGCGLLFENVYTDQPIKMLDLSGDGDVKISWDGTKLKDKFQSCKIDSIVFFHNGLSVGNNNFLVVKDYINQGYRRLIKIEWDDDDIPQACHGKVLKASMTCNITKRITGKLSTIKETRCIVFKAAGTLTITRKPLPSSSSTTIFVSNTSPVQSSTTLNSEQPTSVGPSSTSLNSKEPTSTAQSLSKRPPTVPGHSSSKRPPIVPAQSSSKRPPTVPGHSKSSKRPPTTVLPSESSLSKSSSISTNGVSKTLPPTERSSTEDTIIMTTSPDSDLNAHKQSKEKGNNIPLISSLVVICVLLLVAFLLYVLWTRKKAATSQLKSNTQGVSNQGARITNNGMMMNNLENIYAEANVENTKPPGKGDIHAYDYASNHYTILNKNTTEEKTNYQPLNTGVVKNMYECIPAQKKINTPSKTGTNWDQPAVSEPVYEAPDQMISERVYNILEDDPTSMYNTLEDDPPNQMISDRDERVYNTLEDDQHDAEPEYLVVFQ